ncbi:MAG TPA: hypothetical protein PK993_05065 [Clostridia bacterium]|nr:hypothetical protein [Clostridia bacterium]
MIEYEYSFKVSDIEPFIMFCENKNYEKEESITQTRVLFKNENGVLARITTNERNNQIKQYLNFKEENDSEKVLKESKETSMLEVNSENKDFIKSMLEILNFHKSKELKRIRHIFKKKKIKFEIDYYIQPEMQVVAIEGEKNEVDTVYKEIESLYEKYKI